MKWWNNLWLNESFATLMEYLATDALHPEWRQWDEFASNEGVAALRRDCIDGVQPVQVDVSSPAEISALFDGAIVYAKGGRLLRMVQTWIGDDAFRRGLTDYFTKFQYDNTTGDDLWQTHTLARAIFRRTAPAEQPPVADSARRKRLAHTRYTRRRVRRRIIRRQRHATTKRREHRTLHHAVRR